MLPLYSACHALACSPNFHKAAQHKIILLAKITFFTPRCRVQGCNSTPGKNSFPRLSSWPLWRVLLAASSTCAESGPSTAPTTRPTTLLLAAQPGGRSPLLRTKDPDQRLSRVLRRRVLGPLNQLLENNKTFFHRPAGFFLSGLAEKLRGSLELLFCERRGRGNVRNQRLRSG